MNRELLELLCCPRDGHLPLELQALRESRDQVETGSLHCRSCRTRYPIAAGIADLAYLGADREAVRVKAAEISARDAEAPELFDSHYTEYQTRAELRSIEGALSLDEGSRLLELGCGTGRTALPWLDRCSWYVGVDFSMESLLRFREKAGPRAGLDLLRADLNHLPFRPARSFDRILSAGVLEHLPSRELRRQLLSRAGAFLKPEGRLVLTTYNFNLARRIRRVPKEGLHGSGIYYYCYGARELAREADGFYSLEGVTGVRNLPAWLPRGIAHSVIDRLDVLLSRLGLDRQLGDLLMIVGRPRPQPGRG